MNETREIGGYFGFEEFGGKEYYPDLLAVNSGRNALLYLLLARNIKKLYIPRFLCDTVARLCEREGFSYSQYDIDSEFMPLFDKELNDGEYIYIVNFYGRISDRQIKEMKKRWNNIIFDNVQAFFRKPVKGIDTVYSCRKFFGVPDGGYVATDAVLNTALETDSSRERMTHILGRLEQSGSEFYKDFQNNDERFYELELKLMSPITRNILKGIDYQKVISKRNENFALLDSELGEFNKLKAVFDNGPYCYPFYCENGMEIKKKLAEEKIYVPTLWPNVFENGNEMERDYAENILPIPCDQRYSESDMKKVVEAIKKCLKI